MWSCGRFPAIAIGAGGRPPLLVEGGAASAAPLPVPISGAGTSFVGKDSAAGGGGGVRARRLGSTRSSKGTGDGAPGLVCLIL